MQAGRAFSHVCLFVHSLKGKRLELLTPNLVQVYSIGVIRHALTQETKGHRSMSRGYDNRHGRKVASVHGWYSAHVYADVLPASVAGMGQHVDTTAYVFYFPI